MVNFKFAMFVVSDRRNQCKQLLSCTKPAEERGAVFRVAFAM